MLVAYTIEGNLDYVAESQGPQMILSGNRDYQTKSLTMTFLVLSSYAFSLAFSAESIAEGFFKAVLERCGQCSEHLEQIRSVSAGEG